MSEINFSSEMKEALDKENVGDNDLDVKDLEEKTEMRPEILDPKDREAPENNPFESEPSIFDDVFKSLGLTAGESSGESKETSEDDSEGEEDYSEYLEQREDGKYYDKETGKAYDSEEDWVKDQETQAKRYEGAARHWEKVAKREWAQYKDAQARGDSKEASKHYLKSQECYARAKECREKAKHIREKLGQQPESSSTELSRGETELEAKFKGVPKERRDCVKDAFEDAPDAIKDIVNELDKKLKVGYCERGETSYYSPLWNKIFMNPGYDDEEYGEVFVHEFGHFVDDKFGDISSTREFKSAFQKDLEKLYSDGVKQELMEDLISTDAIDDRAVSDILSGAFNNDEEIVKCYYDEGASYFSHPNEYWENGPVDARESETFANLFRIYTDSGRADSKEFVEKYFPNTCEAFKNSL